MNVVNKIWGLMWSIIYWKVYYFIALFEKKCHGKSHCNLNMNIVNKTFEHFVTNSTNFLLDNVKIDPIALIWIYVCSLAFSGDHPIQTVIVFLLVNNWKSKFQEQQLKATLNLISASLPFLISSSFSNSNSGERLLFLSNWFAM